MRPRNYSRTGRSLSSRSGVAVLKPGWLTTVQDLGREGYQQYGMPVSGAMDRYAFVSANRLVGNQDVAAALELTLSGPELLFTQDSVIAVAGADLTPMMDGRAIPLWTSIRIPAGSRLSFAARRSGVRAYLAVAGGIDVPRLFGSRSTHLPSGTGGLHGRALIAGDHLTIGRAIRRRMVVDRSVPERLRSVYPRDLPLRVLPGPQPGYFPAEALNVLTGGAYRLTSRCDRMGYCLTGSPLPPTGGTSWISDATAMGVLQVPPDGQPILLMADRQTTGGYPKIAVVITADLHRAAQLMAGDVVRFHVTTLSMARTLLKAQRRTLDVALPPN